MTGLLKRSFWLCIALMLVCIAMAARYDPYGMDGDAVSFLDMSRGLQQGHAGLAINGYWNPGYSVALAIGDWIVRPSRYNELAVNYAVDGVMFALGLWAVWYLVQVLVEIRSTWGREFAVPPKALAILGFGILFEMYQQELSVGRVRSDGLLLVFLIFAATFALQLLWTRRMVYALPLGVMLAGAYYTKAFGFVASLMLFLLLAAGMLAGRRELGDGTQGAGRWKPLLGVGVAGLLFLALVAPYIAGISRQRERLTIGDSSRLLYAWFIDGGDSIHESYSHHMGTATNQLKHPERRIFERPPVYSYQDHLNGTTPIWFDPAWWHDKTTPHGNMPMQVWRVFRDVALTGRFLLQHAAPMALLALMLAMGYRLRFRVEALPYLLPVLWGLGMWMVYMVIEIEDRYVDVPYLLLLLPVFALLELRKDREATDAGSSSIAAVALVLMFGAYMLTVAGDVLSVEHRLVNLQGLPGGWYDPGVQEAARALDAMGVHPGDRVASNGVMYSDPYVLYLSGVQMVAEIEGNDTLPATGSADDDALMKALHSTGAKAIVISFGPGAAVPAGWQRLGRGPYFARLIP